MTTVGKGLVGCSAYQPTAIARREKKPLGQGIFGIPTAKTLMGKLFQAISDSSIHLHEYFDSVHMEYLKLRRG